MLYVLTLYNKMKLYVIGSQAFANYPKMSYKLRSCLATAAKYLQLNIPFAMKDDGRMLLSLFRFRCLGPCLFCFVWFLFVSYLCFKLNLCRQDKYTSK